MRTPAPSGPPRPIELAASSLSRATVRDDLGIEVPVTGAARRVVSLVPSLTESVALTRPGALVGATDWSTHPHGLAATRVRGTKNPNLARIIDLSPDLVIANKEENPRAGGWLRPAPRGCTEGRG